MFQGKPIIGIAGGIGSGKSFVAGLFGEIGCLVISSDEQVSAVYRDPQVKAAIRQWWGDQVFGADGEVNRQAIAQKVFSQPGERLRLERLLHPIVNARRRQLMEEKASDSQVLAYAWDVPLLFEVGLNVECDAVVFVEADWGVRLQRVQRSRGWSAEELKRREKLQLPLDKKREISDYVIVNTAGAADEIRAQVREVLSRILAGSTSRPSPNGDNRAGPPG